MLNRNGNPTARNLGLIVRSIAQDLRIRPRVETALTEPAERVTMAKFVKMNAIATGR
jgi:hypothetical protein